MFPGPVRHRFLFGRGMVSDDTEHTLMVLRSLLESPDDPAEFQRRFARHLRGWILTFPAGMGFATLKAAGRLLIGIPPTRSGMMSAGNGAVMRAAVIGAWFRDDPERRVRFVEAASVVTHRDIRAIEGAQLIALAAASDPAMFDSLAVPFMTHPAWREGQNYDRGVSGYVIPTVLTALDIWRCHPDDYRAAITKAIAMGGDTDTVAAIVGGLVGARVGEEGIPIEWRQGMWEWPRGLDYMRNPGTYPRILVPLRNALFLVTVLGHGFRRLLPPR